MGNLVELSRTQEMIDTVHGLIAYSGIEQAVIGTPIFNRLHRVLQSSLVYLTYPSNKVKRFEHSVGTMYLSGKFFFHSICNSSPKAIGQFLSEVNKELINWNKNTNKLFGPYNGSFIHAAVRGSFANEKVCTIPWPSCRLYLENIPANLKEEQCLAYLVVYQSIRLVGLLHDVGHLPYSHVLEYALQRLYQRVSLFSEEKRNEAQQYFLDVMKPYCGSSDPEFAIHEQLGQKFVDKIFESITDDLPKQEAYEYYFLAAVLYFTKEILTAQEADNTLFSDLHRIVAGTLDCDRMDYCCRDEYCAGTSKELPDYGRIFSSIKMVYRSPEKNIYQEEGQKENQPKVINVERERCYFSPSTKALREIETLLRHRWDIYATINYHHRVHKHELLFQEVLAQLGLDEMFKIPQRPEALSDTLPLSVDAVWRLVDQMDNAAPVEYIALQMDDSWLDTLLKHKYFQQYKNNYLSFTQNGADIMWHRLDELISGKKHYHSLIKRSGGFRQFDEYVYEALIQNNIPGLLAALEIKTEERHIQYVENHAEYVFNRVLRSIAPDKEWRSSLFYLFNQYVEALINEKKDEYRIADYLLGDCSFSMGIKQTDSLYITAPEQEEKPFVRYSALYNVLSCEKKLLPSVHIYYLPQYDTAHSEYFVADVKNFLRDVAIVAGKTIQEVFTRQQNQPRITENSSPSSPS